MTEPMVEAIGVHKSYVGVEVLKGVNLTVARGEVTCLIGPSGSGKSTFLRCINHLESMTPASCLSTANSWDTNFEVKSSTN